MERCSQCEGQAVYYSRGENRHYCFEHLTSRMSERVAGVVAQLPEKRPKLVLYYSAGKDSSVLLYILRKHLNLDVVALTIDVGTGGYFERIISVGRAVCSDLGIPLYGVSLKKETGIDLETIARTNSSKVCHYCGELRNAVLDACIPALKADAGVVGHNQDDCVRLIINNYLRNDIFRTAVFASSIYPPPKLASSIETPPSYILRPLIGITEKEISIYKILTNIPLIREYCSYGMASDNVMQSWRSRLTQSIADMDYTFPWCSSEWLSNFEKSFLKCFVSYASELSNWKERLCVYCKRPMNSLDTQVFCACSDCMSTVGASLPDSIASLTQLN